MQVVVDILRAQKEASYITYERSCKKRVLPGRWLRRVLDHIGDVIAVHRSSGIWWGSFAIFTNIFSFLKRYLTHI